MSGTISRRALAYIAGPCQIREVILTGGDPFILSPRGRRKSPPAGGNPHVKLIRWHTRVPGPIRRG